MFPMRHSNSAGTLLRQRDDDRSPCVLLVSLAPAAHGGDHPPNTWRNVPELPNPAKWCSPTATEKNTAHQLLVDLAAVPTEHRARSNRSWAVRLPLRSQLPFLRALRGSPAPTTATGNGRNNARPRWPKAPPMTPPATTSTPPSPRAPRPWPGWRRHCTAPLARITPGTVLEVFTEDCFAGRVRTSADLVSQVCQFPFLNPQTGPFYIEGAQPGDTLAVHFVSIEAARDWGASTTVPLFGALTSTTPPPPCKPRCPNGCGSGSWTRRTAPPDFVPMTATSRSTFR